MRRFYLLLRHEFMLTRTALVIHLVAIAQPTVLYLVMSLVLVHPTFEMNMVEPETPAGWALLTAMETVGSPIGEPYIQPTLIDPNAYDGTYENVPGRQIVVVEPASEGTGSQPVATQLFGLIDSNMVKNYRNRLTAAALVLWNQSLGAQAIQIEQRPWLEHDVPYTLYFGMAALPLAVAVAASLVGAMLTAQEFETGAMMEYRLSPTPAWMIVTARLTRLMLTGLLSGAVLLVGVRLVTGLRPDSYLLVLLTLIPAALIASCLGVAAGLLLRQSIPAFLIGLVTAFVGWLLGSAFGLSGQFSSAYGLVSRLTPNTHTVDLLFSRFFYTPVGNPLLSASALALMSAVLLAGVILIYRRRIYHQE